MANRVHLELRGSDLPHLAEEDEEARVRLSCNNGLPLFWLALLDQADLDGGFAEGVRAAFADPEGLTPIAAVSVPWQTARSNLGEVRRSLAGEPALADAFSRWADGLEALAGRGPTQEARLDLAEAANFHEGAEPFLVDLRLRLAVLRGESPLASLAIEDPARDLTGFDEATGQPFPESMPQWLPGRASPPSPGSSPKEQASEWLMTGAVVAATLAVAWLGAQTAGSTGAVAGGILGLLAAGAGVWACARRHR